MKIVHFEFLEQGRTVSLHCYLEILAKLREDVSRRRLELWPDAWILHHDNALAHDVLAVREFLAKNIDNEIEPSTIFARISPVRLLDIPKTEDCFEGQTLPTFRDMRRLSCRVFQKRSSRNVLSSANTDSLSVLVRKETTSKETAIIRV
jgi:hypothetical protein